MSRHNTILTRPMTIRKMVEDVNDEKVSIPIFQRDFVWKENQVKDLFDSIKNGFPIGSILLWSSNKPLDRRNFIEGGVKSPGDSDWYILDGRQRLTAFYGCILRKKDKPEIFNLHYHLKSDTFEYRSKNINKDDFSVPVSDIFDTFTLIGVLQRLQSKYGDNNEVFEYLNRAKILNSILQEYQVIVIELGECELKSALKVFSRINTKGTELTDPQVFQALTYTPDKKLLSDEIQDILRHLAEYGFDSLSQNDILKCFYTFADKYFFDISSSNSASVIESLSLTDYSTRARETVCLTAKFLHDECFVPNSSLLPYKNQFLTLSLFFKNGYGSQEERKELRKWFFYTTIKESFQNGSLSNVRSLVRRFLEFVNGERSSAIDYNHVEITNPKSKKINLRSAKSKFWAITLNWVALKNMHLFHKYQVKIIHIGGNNAENMFLTYSDNDVQLLKNLLAQDKFVILNNDYCLKRFLLSDSMVKEFKIDYQNYSKNRTILLQAYQQELWEFVSRKN